MGTSVKWLAALFAGGIAGVTVQGAMVGDLVYKEDRGRIAITAPQASAVADWARSVGCYSGANADLNRVVVYRTGSGVFCNASSTNSDFQRASLTPAQAAAAADWGIARGCWDGNRGDLLHLAVMRHPDGIYCNASGYKTVSLSSVEPGNMLCVLGIVE